MVSAILASLLIAAVGSSRSTAQELKNRLGVANRTKPDLRAGLLALRQRGAEGRRAFELLGMVMAFMGPLLITSQWDLVQEGGRRTPLPPAGVTTPFDALLIWLGNALVRTFREQAAEQPWIADWAGVWSAEYGERWPDDTVVAQAIAGRMVAWRDWLKDAAEAAQGTEEPAPHLPSLTPAQVARQAVVFYQLRVGPVSFRGPVSRGVEVLRLLDGWVVDRLVSERQLKEEGASMRHCVGGYWAEGSRGDGGVRDDAIAIFSLRDPKGVPHATWEVNRREEKGELEEEGELLQVHGPEDRDLLDMPHDVQQRVELVLPHTTQVAQGDGDRQRMQRVQQWRLHPTVSDREWAVLTEWGRANLARLLPAWAAVARFPWASDWSGIWARKEHMTALDAMSTAVIRQQRQAAGLALGDGLRQMPPGDIPSRVVVHGRGVSTDDYSFYAGQREDRALLVMFSLGGDLFIWRGRTPEEEPRPGLVMSMPQEADWPWLVALFPAQLRLEWFHRNLNSVLMRLGAISGRWTALQIGLVPPREFVADVLTDSSPRVKVGTLTLSMPSATQSCGWNFTFRPVDGPEGADPDPLQAMRKAGVLLDAAQWGEYQADLLVRWLELMSNPEVRVWIPKPWVPSRKAIVTQATEMWGAPFPSRS